MVMETCFKNRIDVIKSIFARPVYLFIALGTAFFFFLLNAFIIQHRVLFSRPEDALQILFMEFYYRMTSLSFYSLLVIALLTGIVVSMLFYKVHSASAQKAAGAGFISTLGVLLGILVPGCASCGIGLLAFLGLGASVASLPFQGVEISVAAIALLGVSIFSISSGILKCTSCRIPLRKRIKKSS